MSPQKDLENRIDTLNAEIVSLEKQLEETKKSKSDYCGELLSDRVAQERRLEQLAGGYGAISEYSDDQLARVRDFSNSIRVLENKIRDCHAHIRGTQEEIEAQQQRAAAEAALAEPIKRFNSSLGELKRLWQHIEALADAHDVELEQILPEGTELELYETTPKPGYCGTWLKITFAD